MTSRVEVLKTEVLSDNWYVLRKVTFRLRKRDGSWEVQSREAYDRARTAGSPASSPNVATGTTGYPTSAPTNRP